MPVDDFRINRAVKSVLTRHWVDTEKLKFHTSRSIVRFSGLLTTTGMRKESQLDASLLEILMSEIRRIRGVDKVYFTGVEIDWSKKKEIKLVETMGATRTPNATRRRRAVIKPVV